MRLYLSSFRLGPHHLRLLALLGSGRRTALIPNALDGLPSQTRAVGLARDVSELSAAGLQVDVVDLREASAAGRLAGYDLVWVRGGNVFVLRRAMADSGADDVLVELLHADQVVYGGFSAGACVLGADLSPLSRVDPLQTVTDPITAGLGLLDRPFVPHVGSPQHPESTACDEVAAGYQQSGVVIWGLRDGEVLLVDGQQVEVLKA